MSQPLPARPSPRPSPRVPQPPGTALGRGKTMLSDKYMLGEELGRGAYGQVSKLAAECCCCVLLYSNAFLLAPCCNLLVL